MSLENEMDIAMVELDDDDNDDVDGVMPLACANDLEFNKTIISNDKTSTSCHNSNGVKISAMIAGTITASAMQAGVVYTKNLTCKRMEVLQLSNDGAVANINSASVPTDATPSEFRLELDTHANMPVVGKGAYIVASSGQTADVNAYDPQQGTTKLPIVDAAVQYDCPYTGKSYVFIIRNALHVPSMDNHLIPPFILREAGIEVNDVPKIQVEDPDVKDHSLHFSAGDVRIPLSLHGVFSYFPTSKPSAKMLEECEDIYLLTPTSWDPHDPNYAHNEAQMLDWQGELRAPALRQKLVLSDIEEDAAIAAACFIGKVETLAITSILDRQASDNGDMGHSYAAVPPSANEIAAVLSHVSPTLDDITLCRRLITRHSLGQFQMSVGSTCANSDPYLFDISTVSDSHGYGVATKCGGHSKGPRRVSWRDPLVDDSEQVLLDDLYHQSVNGQLDLDDKMVSALDAGVINGVTPSHLSKIWRIDADTAKRTIDITSQRLVRMDNPKLSRNYGTNDRMLRYKHLNEYFFMDTLFATKEAMKSSRGHTCVQLFVTDKGFVYVVPMKRESEVLQAIKQFAKAIGAPDAIICDASKAQTSQKVKQFCRDIGTTLRILEENTPWANKAELYVGIIKEATRKDMKASTSPLVFWDYCMERRARINNLTAKDLFSLHGSNAYSSLMGEEGDISALCQYDWYDWCYYRENKENFPFNREVLGRVLGPSSGEGNEMAQWVLKANGNVVPRRTLRPLTVDEQYSPTEQKKRETFDSLISRRWGTAMSPPQVSENDDDPWEVYVDDDELPRHTPEIEDVVDASGKVLCQQPAYDKIINAEVLLQNGESLQTAKVRRRSIGPDGTTVGKYHDNPFMNSIIYDVEFPDGTVKEYGANIIAENMVSQVDADGFSLTMMEGIVGHEMDTAVAIPKHDKHIVTRSGQKRLRKTTKGWKLLVKWKDESESWIPLKDMKESHPVEVAEYAKSRGIDNEAAFAWWVPYTLRKRDIILSAVKSRIRKTTHKYGIEIPNTVEEAIKLDQRNGNTYWHDATKLEMFNVGVAFEILDENQIAPQGWHPVTGHLVFDVKMDFTRKARFVLDGHKTPDVIGSSYAGVVSRDSVRIAFTYAALNDLNIFAADIRNAYLQAPSSRKDYIVCGSEFGLENVGRVALIHRALYGGKTAGSDFRNHLRSCMRHLEFDHCLADPDVWMRPAKKSDGSSCYEYILLYVDDVLVISDNAESVLRNGIGRYFDLKESSIGPPKLYLGGHVRKVELDNGAKAWAFSSSQYVQAAVKNVEAYLNDKDKYSLPKKAETPMTTSYRPELDVTPELPSKEAAYYMSLIGILRWIVELGRVDICLEVSIMSSHMAMPREGHLAQLFHIFAYLKKYHNTELVFDPSDPVVDESKFQQQDWTSSEFGHVMGKQELPPNMPEPRGLGFTIRAKVDADHASDSVTRRSRTGFLVYINSALVYWHSKKQNCVESSSFGSEFCAMKQCCEYIRGLAYKLRMMGIPYQGPAYIEADNQSVLANTTIPDSTLKKKSQSIAYHMVREGVARDEWRTAYINSTLNEADLLTKQLPSGEKRKGFVMNLIHHIFRSN